MSHPRAPAARRRVVEAPRQRSEVRSLRIVIEPDLDPDVGRAVLREDEFVGVRAEADVLIGGTEQTLSSTGLWGVESDTEDEYLDEIIAEEWATLRNVLKAVGVSTEQLPLEASREWIEWRT